MGKLRAVICFFVALGIISPVLYTVYAMGLLTPKPVVSIKNTVTDSSEPPLRVVADFDFSPYSFFDDKHDASGLDVELINEIANRLGRKTTITFTDWISCKKAIPNGEAELILGLEIFSNMEGVLKTVAASSDDLVVFGKNKINSIAALEGKKVGLMGNSVIEKIFDLNCQYVPLFTNTQILDAINNGDIDYGICHGSVARKILEKSDYDIYPSVVLMKSYPAIGVRSDLVELRDQINDVLAQLSAEGFITQIDEKWLVKFTRSSSVGETIKKHYPSYILYFAVYIAFMFALVLFYIQGLHRERELKSSIDYKNAIIRQMELQRISMIDELTQINNRRSFENKLDDLRAKKVESVTIFAFDVNGLKTANDNIGHAAGDELICGAADCMKIAFGDIGECYRTGGDEFIVIAESLMDDETHSLAEHHISYFRDTVKNWYGNYIKSLSVSSGYAASSEIENFTYEKLHELLELADKRMYSDKTKYYETSGVSRRV